MSQEAKILQEQLWLLIDSLYQSGLNTSSIGITVNFSTTNGKIDSKFYSVKYFGRDGHSFSFLTSEHCGVWGVENNMTIEEIIRLLKEEIRESKLEHILK